MELDSAHALIAKAIQEGRPAHGYLVVGGVRGMALDLARAVLQDLFPGVEEEGLRTHPDIHWLFPEKKSRIVSVEAEHVTSCCFGGGDLRTLYITTAGEDLSGPWDGSLFSCKVDAQGLRPDPARLGSI